ncbi:MAG: helix-turn-helix domain-containing protein [Dehalococcoidales bacterium]|nr:helix-turn-helix domain-containing protein [Dehalococcoidales bacterium]
MANNDSLVMSIPEFARVMGISRGSAYSFARQNKLPVPVIFIGDKRMVLSRRSVERLLSGEGNSEQ